MQGLALRHLVVAQSDSWASVFILEACGASGSLGAPDTALPEHTSPRGGGCYTVPDASVQAPPKPSCVQMLL